MLRRKLRLQVVLVFSVSVRAVRRKLCEVRFACVDKVRAAAVLQLRQVCQYTVRGEWGQAARDTVSVLNMQDAGDEMPTPLLLGWCAHVQTVRCMTHKSLRDCVRVFEISFFFFFARKESAKFCIDLSERTDFIRISFAGTRTHTHTRSRSADTSA